nr:PBECR2 nuclease fold domain-containing protein [uncultured Tolumonas sp.]
MPESTPSSRQSIGPFIEKSTGPLDARHGSQYFQEAITYFRDKVNIKGDAWDSLWQGQHATAFTVAGAMKDDLLCDLRQAVDKAISQGVSLADFRKQFKEIVAKNGWVGFTGDGTNAGVNWRAKVIYDTNVRQAYNAGRWQQLQQFDIWVYHHGDSRNPRPTHLSWNGLVLKKDDPWWSTHFPQNGWGCKCYVTGYSTARAKIKGIEPGIAPDDGTFDYVNKNTGEVSQIPKGIDPGFDYSVGEAKFGKRLSEQQFAEWQETKSPAWKSLTPGNWQTAGQPERLPYRALPVDLGEQVATTEEVVTALKTVLGGDEKLFTTPAGPVLIDANVLGEHINPERAAYLPLLTDALENPQEIWLSFEQHQGTGKVVLKTRFLTVYQLRDGRGVLLVTNAVKGVLSGWTFFSAGDMKYLNKQRIGELLYSEGKN